MYMYIYIYINERINYSTLILESLLTWSKIIFTINSFRLVFEFHESNLRFRFVEVYNHINY